MQLCVAHIQNVRVTKLEFGNPKKPDTQSTDDISLRAAACWHLGQELLSTVPVNPKALMEAWYNNFAQGDGAVNDELQGLLLDRSSSLNVRSDIPTFKRLVDDLNFSKPIAPTPEAELAIVVDKFHLVVKQLDYDIAVYQTWRSKCASLKTAAESAKHQWRLDRRKRCHEAAKHFMDTSMAFHVWPQKRKPESAIAEIMNLKKALCARSGAKMDEISYIIYLNCSVPCLIPSAVLSQQVAVLSWALSDQMRSVGLLMCPIYTHQRGKLCIDEHSILDKIFTGGNHNCDWSFHVLFTDRSDQRDLRPMVYGGKFIFASPLDLSQRFGLTFQ